MKIVSKKVLYCDSIIGELFRKGIGVKFLLNLAKTIKYKSVRLIHEKFLFRLLSKQAVFISIYKNNYWGSSESLSGPGSTLEYTENLRIEIPKLFREFGIKKVFDAPCGDMHWMSDVLTRVNINYLGGDIVPDLIERNKKLFSGKSVDFKLFDITKDEYPVADVWLCRAVLYHLSFDDIYLALDKFVNSEIKYILTTTAITPDSHLNKDVLTGDWRVLNLMLPPFNFPSSPLFEIKDYIEPFQPESLALWTRDQIREAIANRNS